MEFKKFLYSLLVALVLSSLPVNCVEKARYDNYRIYEVLIENEEHLDLVKDIDNYGVSVKLFY